MSKKLKGAVHRSPEGLLTVTIPTGGNEIYQKLTKLVGEPVSTERFHLGLTGLRTDRFCCGCVRTYRASMITGTPEAEETLAPCSEHQKLV